MRIKGFSLHFGFKFFLPVLFSSLFKNSGISGRQVFKSVEDVDTHNRIGGLSKTLNLKYFLSCNLETYCNFNSAFFSISDFE